MELLRCSNQSSPMPATQWRSQPMASQSTESSFVTPRREPQTLVGEPSHRGHSESMTSPQDSYGSHPSTTRCPLIADTTDRSRFRRFGTICAPFRGARHNTTLRWCLLIGMGVLIGSIAWSGYLPTIPLSLLVFLLLGRLGTRQRVLGLMVGYYAGATWQIIPGAGTFFGHHATLVHVLLLWMGTSIVLGLAWAPLALRNRRTRLYTVPLTILLLAVSPLGLIGVASPL